MIVLGRLCASTFEAASRAGFTELEATRAAAAVAVAAYNPRRPWDLADAAACALEAFERAADEGATVPEQWAAFAKAVAREPDDGEAARVAQLERALGRDLPLALTDDGRFGRVLVEVPRREPPEPWWRRFWPKS